MPHSGNLAGMIQDAIHTGMTKASIAVAEAKMQDVEKANQDLRQRWEKMLSSPEVIAYKGDKNLNDWNQTQLIIDLENLLNKLTTVVIAQQHVLEAVIGTLKNLNAK